MQPNRLQGAVDIHIHTSPDIFERNVTATLAGEMARDAGMAAIVVKSHSTDTAARASEATDRSGFPVYGGVALNYSVGGLNPYAVSESARQGGRLVWMPTLGAEHFVKNAHHAPMLQSGIPAGVSGIRVLDEHGQLKPEVFDILDVIAANDMVLCSGHVSPEETAVLVPAAHAHGIRRIVITHPQAPFVAMGEAEMTSLADYGAFMELTPMLSVHERAEIIRSVGVENCLISTDGGTVARAQPVHGLQEYVDGLVAEGFSDKELLHLTVEAPSHVLGLDGWEERPRLSGSEHSEV